MLTEIRLTDCIGRTLRAAEYSHDWAQLALIFTDGTFATLGVSRGCENGDEEITENQFNWESFGYQRLVQSGIMTQEEVQQRQEERDHRIKERRRERDLAEFESLRHRLGK
jgi:hypothetical protein